VSWALSAGCGNVVARRHGDRVDQLLLLDIARVEVDRLGDCWPAAMAAVEFTKALS